MAETHSPRVWVVTDLLLLEHGHSSDERTMFVDNQIFDDMSDTYSQKKNPKRELKKKKNKLHCSKILVYD